jgi:hypothetical protein
MGLKPGFRTSICEITSYASLVIKLLKWEVRKSTYLDAPIQLNFVTTNRAIESHDIDFVARESIGIRVRRRSGSNELRDMWVCVFFTQGEGLLTKGKVAKRKVLTIMSMNFTVGWLSWLFLKNNVRARLYVITVGGWSRRCNCENDCCLERKEGRRSDISKLFELLKSATWSLHVGETANWWIACLPVEFMTKEDRGRSVTIESTRQSFHTQPYYLARGTLGCP